MVLAFFVAMIAGACILVGIASFVMEFPPHIHDNAQRIAPNHENPIHLLGGVILFIGLILMLAAFALASETTR